MQARPLPFQQSMVWVQMVKINFKFKYNKLSCMIDTHQHIKNIKTSHNTYSIDSAKQSIALLQNSPKGIIETQNIEPSKFQ